MAYSAEDKARIEAISQDLLRMTGEFSDQYLDEDYKQLAAKLIAKMKRKRVVPFLQGKPAVWAAAVIYALGQINFLFDPSFEPYVTPDQIAEYFGVSKSAIGQKAKKIRDMFKMGYWDSEFSTEYMRKGNPIRKFVLVDGPYVPADMLFPALQEKLRRGGGPEGDA